MSKKHLQGVLDKRAAEHKEDLAREKRNYGEIRPPEAQVGKKTWKSYSQIRRPSEAFRKGWSYIDWSA